MPIAGIQPQPPLPNIRLVPAGRVATKNIVGYYGQSGQRKKEIAILLNSFNIKATTFEQNVARTRLNIMLMQNISDYFSTLGTLKVERVKHSALCADGDSTQLIKHVPTEENVTLQSKWTHLIVGPYMSNTETLATIGASYLVAFQLQKEPITGNHANWYPLVTTQQNPANPEWIANRNDRRELPDGFCANRFCGISDSLKNRANALVRRLIKAQM
ncbi:hypothetical protein EVAR_10320_1 [Eumeta japonica]|uniref:Uncharacterized protein n=1 Tax=Eumeta variegata TaxID=151549 RepID=A0A4C1TEV5_EUMVA|nr:hypothetical protein EVAR_10320_1 [Eumeta japonica]